MTNGHVRSGTEHAEMMHINIDITINGGKNTRSGENTHTYPIRGKKVKVL